MNIKNFDALLLRALCAFAVILFLVPSARADAPWTLTDAQFQSSNVQVDSIDAQGIRTASSDTTGPAMIDWKNVLELSYARTWTGASAGPSNLFMIGGDHIGGSPVGLTGDMLQWHSPILGDLSLPQNDLLAISRQATPPPGLDQTRSDDVLRLNNGDTTHGIVTQITDTGVTLQAGDASPTLSWDAIAAVLFSGSGSAPPTDARAFRVSFIDGTSITVKDLSLSSGKLTLNLDAKTSRDVEVSQVTGIEQLNGPISWLTSRQPVQNVYKPYFSENFPARFDGTVDGLATIHQRYPQFHHGIGCHSYSKLVYALDGKWAAFQTQFVVDSDSPLADVTARILLDDKVVLERKNLKAGHVEPAVIIPLGDAKTLALEVDYGANYATQGRFAWLDPALLREMPQLPSPPATEPTTQP